jgi:hypothetical protein
MGIRQVLSENRKSDPAQSPGSEEWESGQEK